MLTAIDAVAIDLLIPAIPQLRRAFSIGPDQAAATVSIFVLGLAIGQLLYGPVSDRLGRKPPLIAGLLVFVVGSVFPLYVRSFACLLIGRLLQSLGAAAGLVIGRAVVVDVFPAAQSSRVFSILMQVLGVGTIVAPLVGGYLAGSAGWESVFWALAGFGVICLMAVVLTLEESHTRLEKPGSGAARFEGFGALLGDRVFLAYCLCSGCIMAGMFATVVGNAFVFVDFFGWSAMSYASLYSLGCIGFVIAGGLNALALRRYSPSRILGWSLAVVAACAGGLWALEAAGYASADRVAILSMASLAATGSMFGNVAALAMNRARRAAGTGSSLLGVSQYAIAAAAGPSAATVGGTALHSTSVTCAIFYCSALLLFVLGRMSRNKVPIEQCPS